jgi:hypothetical protein
MRKIFSKIHTDDTATVRRSNEIPVLVLPHDQLMAELFYPHQQVNVDTTKMVKLTACEIAQTILKELRDPKKPPPTI